MHLETENGHIRLAMYASDSASPAEFALWFETEFQCELDYTNMDAFEDDFRYGIMGQTKYDGIIHTACTPDFFQEGFYKSVYRAAISDGKAAGRRLSFVWP